MAFPKKLSGSMPPLRDQGMHYLTAAAAPGVAIQQKKITQPGAAPLVVVFADEGMSDMADTDYSVMVGGEAVGAFEIDESTITTKGFSVTGGAITEVCHIIVAGRLAGQVGPA